MLIKLFLISYDKQNVFKYKMYEVRTRESIFNFFYFSTLDVVQVVIQLLSKEQIKQANINVYLTEIEM